MIQKKKSYLSLCPSNLHCLRWNGKEMEEEKGNDRWWTIYKLMSFKVTVVENIICSQQQQQKRIYPAPRFSTRGWTCAWTCAAVLHDLDYALEFVRAIFRCRGCRGSQ